MLVRLPWPVALGVDAGLWAVWSLLVGWWAARQPAERFAAPAGPLRRLRPFEAGGGWYERHLHVTRWKDRLPEAGTWFGGLSKRTLPPGSGRVARLQRFAAESARAETVHWLALALVPVFAVWTPLWLVAGLAAGGLAFNLPCIVVARYNRARVAAALARRPA